MARANGIRAAAIELRRFILALVPAALLAYGVMALLWPWSVVNPLNPFRAIGYFSHFFEAPWQELFGGVLISVPDMPRSYVPVLFALKLPEIFIVLGFGGAAGALERHCDETSMCAAAPLFWQWRWRHCCRSR